MPTKTESVKTFLVNCARSDLADLYHRDMECQVNVAEDGGESVSGDYKGKIWNAWTDGVQTWKAFRIPYKASTVPEFNDTEMKFDMSHALGIGMTGWDWVNLCSRWVAFDFDAISGHSDGHNKTVTNEEMRKIETAATSVEWVTVRRSTSARGLHLYIFLDSVPTKNHNEHAALARAILGKLSALAGYDFEAKVDACGGNMWIWHRAQSEEGLSLVKQGSVLKDVPRNWRDHVKVITGQRRKNLPKYIEDNGSASPFEELCGQRHMVKLDDAHKRVINYLTDSKSQWWWDADHHMMVAHTADLLAAHNELALLGTFQTIAKGSERGADHNCFAYPLRGGSWAVRRYTMGCSEAETWEQDQRGWTRCYLNREPDLRTAAGAFGGIENNKGGFVFQEAKMAVAAAQLLGVFIKLDIIFMNRPAVLRTHKDGRLIVDIERAATDDPSKIQGFLIEKDKQWSKIFNSKVGTHAEPEAINYDDVVRHLVTDNNEDYGWMIRGEDAWRKEPLTHVRVVLGSFGYGAKELTQILGSSVMRCWKLVNKPFQPEYTGDREWNRNAAQLKYLPSAETDSLSYPSWRKVLDHCGSGLDEAVLQDGWAKANGILTGGDYLKVWIASLFQKPTEPLPYLFFYGPQNSGKSIFYEALSLLLTRGYKRADVSLTSQSGFNGELEGAILCVIEETDLRTNKQAYNKIKDWVTSRELLIHFKGLTPYHIPNTTHWVQCSNEHQSCPIFSGDTRITMGYVKSLTPVEMIPKSKLLQQLQKEAPDFLAGVLGLDIPDSLDRLSVPVLTTSDKRMVEESNRTSLEHFIVGKTFDSNGETILFSEFYETFLQWIDPSESHQWTKQRVSRELPPQICKGRRSADAQVCLGNISFEKPNEDHLKIRKLILQGDYLR